MVMDLGQGQFLTPQVYPPTAGPELAGKLAGFFWMHSRPDGSECPVGANPSNWIPASDQPQEHHWHIEQGNPLTLRPSLLCRECGMHVYVTNGKAQVL